MILANIEGNTSIFFNSEAFIEATFNPCIEYEALYLGAIKGKTYAERKENAREKAVEYSINIETFTSGLSWGEVYTIQCYFENIAKKYGLLREFRENAIL